MTSVPSHRPPPPTAETAEAAVAAEAATAKGCGDHGPGELQGAQGASDRIGSVRQVPGGLLLQLVLHVLVVWLRSRLVEVVVSARDRHMNCDLDAIVYARPPGKYVSPPTVSMS